MLEQIPLVWIEDETIFAGNPPRLLEDFHVIFVRVRNVSERLRLEAHLAELTIPASGKFAPVIVQRSFGGEEQGALLAVLPSLFDHVFVKEVGVVMELGR
jgi:hypothetical protein